MEEDRRAGLDPCERAAGQLTSSALPALADAYGVATGYEGSDGRWRAAPESSVRAALAVMGVACATEAEVSWSLRQTEATRWARLVPPTTVQRRGSSQAVVLRVPSGADLTAVVHLEDGGVRPVPGAPVPTGETTDLHGGREAVHLALPVDLPLGYHELHLAVSAAGDRLEGSGYLVVAPQACPERGDVPATWGWMAQLYALRSESSWGIGDLADLRGLLGWSAPQGADFTVVNPLHAVAPVMPLEDSPYYPSSRRFTSPLYLAVEDVPEAAALADDAYRRLTGLASAARALNTTDRIDRDAVFAAKDEALRLLFEARQPGQRAAAFDAYRRREGAALRDFATFCALSRQHGLPFQSWPEALRHPRSPAVEAFRREHAEEVEYHAWLQALCDEQLQATQEAALAAGARLGVLHDLAVGVDKGGADAWALQDELGLGAAVGAPPDAFNQQGQDWAQPPLLPHRLRQSGYAPFRQMVQAALRHAGGVRIDHIIGLFRLYWIPDGAPADAGTYVRYPADELLGVLALEAWRADALVVGEDLGTVEPGVREALAAHNILSSSVLYFERDDADPQAPRAAADYPDRAMSSVTTHDLPTAAGWWLGEDARLRIELGLLGAGVSAEQEWQAKDEDRHRLEQLLRAEGLLDADAGLDARVLAMHAFLARTPSRLLAVSPADAVGDLRQPNLPGTVSAYPSWRLPLAEPTDHGHRPVLLEDLASHPRTARLLAVLSRR